MPGTRRLVKVEEVKGVALYVDEKNTPIPDSRRTSVHMELSRLDLSKAKGDKNANNGENKPGG